jgi:hypothetical protein
MVSSVSLAGPTVAIIFVCLNGRRLIHEGHDGYEGNKLFWGTLYSMTVKTWLEAAVHDAERRGLIELKPLLEMLARATSALRTAEWNADASGEFDHAAESDGR